VNLHLVSKSHLKYLELFTTQFPVFLILLLINVYPPYEKQLIYNFKKTPRLESSSEEEGKVQKK
jgi:hypothetical protein